MGISSGTGCVRDLQRLWHFTERELLGESPQDRKWGVVSRRHGNTYTLANRRLLELAGVIARPVPRSYRTIDNENVRPTTVNLSFITPKAAERGAGSSTRHPRSLWTFRVVTILQLMAHASIAVVLGVLGLYWSSALVACVVATHVTLLGIRFKVSPIFANRHAVARDAEDKVTGGAALDVHVISPDWNSESIDVLCGYSSQLHALTNIPVQLSNFSIAFWGFRVLALVLVPQAAILASLLGKDSSDVLGPAVWLLLYLEMLLTSTSIRGSGSETVFDCQPAEISTAPALTFKGRKSALLFIAHLPVSQKGERWSWLDPYMPDNPRRRQWQTLVEDMKEGRIEKKAGNGTKESAELESSLGKVQEYLTGETLASQLKSYKLAVRWQEDK